MPKKTVRQMDVSGKRVLLRADLNVTFVPGATQIADDGRIKATLPTIDYLKEHGASIILCSHLGRPKGQVVEEMRLAPVADRLMKLLGRPVKYVKDCIGPEVEEAARELKPGDVLLLENLRFHAGEEKNDPEFARSLASLADVYVDDAFGAAHRAHASIHAVTRFLPAAAGIQMNRELKMLGKALDRPLRPLAAVMGGAKVSDKIAVLHNLVSRVDRLFIGGGMAATFLGAQGYESGRSPVEADSFQTTLDILSSAERQRAQVFLPLDFVTADAFDEHASAQIVPYNRVPPNSFIMDIGPGTVESFTQGLDGCSTVIWNGPMGVFEWEAFSKGTRAMAQAIANLKNAITVLGGGSTAEAVSALGLASRVSHVSTGGGASLELMEGKELPGVAVLPDEDD